MDAIPALYGSRRPADEGPMSGRAWRLYLAGGLTAVALYFVLPLEGLWSSLAYDLIGLSSVAAILVAVGHLRPARPLIWWCFAAGQLLFVVGDMLYAVIDLVLHQKPLPLGRRRVLPGRLSGPSGGVAHLDPRADLGPGPGWADRRRHHRHRTRPAVLDLPHEADRRRPVAVTARAADLVGLPARRCAAVGAGGSPGDQPGRPHHRLPAARAGAGAAARGRHRLCRAEPCQQLRRWPDRRRLAADVCDLGGGRPAPLDAVAVRGRPRPGDTVLPPAPGPARHHLPDGPGGARPTGPAPSADRRGCHHARLGGAVPAGGAAHGRADRQGPGPGRPVGRPGPQRRTDRDPQPARLGAGAAPGDGPGPTLRWPAVCRPA